MAHVYLDVSALYLHWDTPEAVVAPEAERAVGLLESDGHEVSVVGSPPGATVRWTRRLPHVERVSPGAPSREPAWLIVGDRSRCAARVGRLRTVLVGGGPVRTGRGQCDLETADLHGAALAVIGGAVLA
jgi:hypothetical protein